MAVSISIPVISIAGSMPVIIFILVLILVVCGPVPLIPIIFVIGHDATKTFLVE